MNLFDIPLKICKRKQKEMQIWKEETISFSSIKMQVGTSSIGNIKGQEVDWQNCECLERWVQFN